MVPKKDIEDNGYDLSINRYKEVEYIPAEYPPTSEIMANIRDIEKEISKEMDELEKLLNLQEGEGNPNNSDLQGKMEYTKIKK